MTEYLCLVMWKIVQRSGRCSLVVKFGRKKGDEEKGAPM